MTFADSTLRWQRWVLAAMLLGSGALMVPGQYLTEPFMLPKITFMTACALALVGLWLARTVHLRRTAVPLSAATGAVAALLVLLVATTVLSDRPWTSLVGYFSRYTGLWSYLVHLVALVAALRLVDLRYGRTLLRTGVVALTVVTGYGLVQAAGLDPVDYVDSGLPMAFSTMGNTNFGGAWAGAASAFAVAVALSRDEERGWRVYAGVVAPLAVVYAVLTGTSQGPVVAVAAVGTTLVVLLSERDHPVRRWVAQRRAAAVGALAALVLLVTGVAVGARSFLAAELDQALVERPEFWAAALDVWRDNPVLGTGLDTFAHVFLAYRPASHALANGTSTTDAPHSVPLGMLSNGGALTFLAWTAVVVLVALAVLRGVRRVHGPERALLAGFSGVLAGYLLQSLISFDMPPLALLFFLSAGAVLALAWPPRWRELRLPGAPPLPAATRRGRQAAPPPVPGSTRVLQGAVAVVLLAVMWLALYPIRADRAAASAVPLARDGQIADAVDRLQRASELNPSEARYLYSEAQIHQQVGDGPSALAAAEKASRRDPGPVEYVLLAARQAEALGELDRTRAFYEQALRRDPRDPPVLNEVALFHLKQAEPEPAVELLERSVALRDDDPESLVLLGQARQAGSDLEGARRAFEQAAAVAPDDELVAQALAGLPA
jgi:tetratricopeptide (TPR) repeat protein